ncbi:MAG: tetratricopeptide repeat protein, partial [Armatimonadetes bacterium]|nr:tetratricopeptide repeat protein [Armatimonadota bacterium]
ARFRIGTCQALLGRPELAMAQWQRVVDDYPESPQAAMARNGIAAWKAMLTLTGLAVAEAVDDALAPWRPFRTYSSEIDKGLSYAEDLYENGQFVYALQEYAKVLCDIYTPKGEPNPHRDYARYRLGVCAYRLGHRDAAARQWRRLAEDAPTSEWAAHANQALAVVGVTDPFSSDASRLAPPLPASLQTGLQKRYHLAALLVDCELPEVAIKEYLKILHVLTAGRPNPLQAEASYLVGVCQHLGRHPDLALAAWRQTVEAYPDTDWAAKAKAAIQQTNRRETAIRTSHSPPHE